MELRLTDPVVVARGTGLVLLANGDVADDDNTDAQTWTAEDGYSDVKPLQVFFKFLYYIEQVDPPEPWTEPA